MAGGRAGNHPISAALVIVVLAMAVAPACKDLEPDVGDPIAACVDTDSNPAVAVSFQAQIRPIMDGRVPGPKPCANCHYHSKGTMEGLLQTGLDLETLATLRRGGRETGTDVVIPGSPCKSAIVQKLRGTYAGGRMPKGGPYWEPEQIQLMIDWIAEGAKGADTD